MTYSEALLKKLQWKNHLNIAHIQLICFKAVFKFQISLFKKICTIDDVCWRIVFRAKDWMSLAPGIRTPRLLSLHALISLCNLITAPSAQCWIITFKKTFSVWQEWKNKYSWSSGVTHFGILECNEINCIPRWVIFQHSFKHCV